MYRTRKQLETRDTNNRMIESLKAEILKKLVTVVDFPVEDPLKIVEYINQLEEIYLDEEVDKYSEEYGEENVDFEVLEELQNRVMDRLIAENISIEKEEQNIVDYILIAELLNKSLSEEVERNKEVTESIIESMQTYEWIDKDISLRLDEYDNGLTLEILYKNREIVVPTQVTDPFTMAYNLAKINEENVVYVDDLEEGSFELNIIVKERDW